MITVCEYRWTWIWQTWWDQENWSVICKIRLIHMANTWYASDWDQAYRLSYAKICRTVVRHIQVHLYSFNMLVVLFQMSYPESGLYLCSIFLYVGMLCVSDCAVRASETRGPGRGRGGKPKACCEIHTDKYGTLTLYICIHTQVDKDFYIDSFSGRKRLKWIA